MKQGLPAGWELCPVWRVWVAGAEAVIVVPQGIPWTASFLGEFCRSTGGCRFHETGKGG